jgi:sphingomyelin phosphodiesterase acid-like 3
MTLNKVFSRICRISFIFVAAAPLAAQSAGPTANPMVRAIFVSDIHLDPFKDPALVARLAGQAALGEEAHATSGPLAAAQQNCRSLPDTSNELFRTGLVSMAPKAASVSFVTVSGDLIAHQFIQCFAAVVLKQQPKDSEAAQYAAFSAEERLKYRNFVQKTIEYITGKLTETFPNTPIYYALGNNDTDCGDYDLDPRGEFLRHMAEIVVNSLPPNLSQADRATVRADFSAAGYYSTALAGAPNTRMIVLGDLFMSGSYATCAGKEDAAPATAELAWLKAQLEGLNPNENAWVMGHIPPGLDIFSSARKMKPVMYLKYDFNDVLTSQNGVVRVGIFAHTHFDGVSQIQSKDSAHPVTLKMVQSISPDHGNLPAYTLADVDAKTGALIDYTLVTAVKSTGGYTWPRADAPLPALTWSGVPAISH